MKYFFLTFLFVTLFLKCAFSEPELKLEEVAGEEPYFFLDVVAFKNPEFKQKETRLEVFLKLPYDSIQFLKLKEVFKGKCEISITVLDKDKKQLAGHTTQKEIEVETYSETNDYGKSIIYAYTFDIEFSKKYFIWVSVMDLDTRSECLQKYSLETDSIDKEGIQMSELVYTEKVGRDSLNQITHFRPSVIHNFDDNLKNFYLYYEIYNFTKDPNLTVSYIVANNKKKEKIIADTTFSLIAGQNKITRQVIQLPSEVMKLGEYFIEVTISNSATKFKREKNLKIQWRQIPFSIANLSDAIEQLRYIAPSKDLERMKKSKGEEQKQNFKAFWKERDPTPNTEINELMLEYYRRVEFSSTHFSNVTPGWKTDRGMVYILFGPPNDIEEHTFEVNTRPYIIWYYYSLGRKFTFVDFRGFGDYELLEPLSSFDTHFNN
ncbi:GWxTD domain-containing protein [bacterium]|nr:GWxTD domain-containing protein [bacterium]